LEVRKTRHRNNIQLTSEGERLVASKSKDYRSHDKNNLSKCEPEEWRDTAG
jgi:hypothetical protein